MELILWVGKHNFYIDPVPNKSSLFSHTLRYTTDVEKIMLAGLDDLGQR